MSKPVVIAGGRGLGKSWAAEIVKRAREEHLAQMALLLAQLEISDARIKRQCDTESAQLNAVAVPQRRVAQWKQERNAHRRNWR